MTDTKPKNTGNMLVTRRDFLKFCSSVAVAMGLGPLMGPKVAEALTSDNRPPVLWLHFSECTGCTESFLRTVSPFADELILDLLSLDYHETLMAGAGDTVHEILYTKANEYQGEFFCVVEGSIPTAENGIYGMINGKTMLSIARDIVPKAKAVLCIGTCSSYGGLAAAAPNPTGAKGLKDALPGLSVPVVNIPGCPPNPINFVAVIADYLMNGTLPDCDEKGRPLFSYGSLVHDQCPYEPIRERHGHCLEYKGCKGKHCYNNCPSIQFNEGTNFPMKAGHPCIGCSEPNFWDTMTPFYGEERVGLIDRIKDRLKR